ncbi:MAG TPA: AEC family transporter [Casimicrobiaceae bacterium]|nr:AEC family transporter [Casimicrobiaceae bacterium]
MSDVPRIFALTSPLFLLVLVGYLLSRLGGWPKTASDALTRFVFSVAIPAFLFRLMSDFARLPHVDARLLLVYFGGCLAVYVLARLLARGRFAMDGEAQSVFAMGGIFSNAVLLGVPVAQATLPVTAMPAVSLVVVFNSLLLWTLVTVSVEWARHRDFSLAGFGKTARSVVLNPVVAGILLGTAWSYTGLALPHVADATLSLLATAAVPMSLVALGMGLAEFGIRAGFAQSIAIAALKLLALPLCVFALARIAGLPAPETMAVVLLAALPTGANVYLMARQFATLEGPIASSLVLTTAIAAVTTPLALVALAALAR